MQWSTANEWIAAMNMDGGTGYLGFNDWRMPQTRPVNGSEYNLGSAASRYDGSSDIGYNVGAPGSLYAGATGSEMAHLFFITLGNQAGFDLAGTAIQNLPPVNTGPFSHFITHPYWSGSQYPGNINDAWEFDFDRGSQDLHYVGNPYYVMSVRSGDVAPVPLPGAIWLLGTGLIGLVMVRRKT